MEASNAKVQEMKKKLRELTKNIACADKLSPIKGQPALDNFVTPTLKKKMLPPAFASLQVSNRASMPSKTIKKHVDCGVDDEQIAFDVDGKDDITTPKPSQLWEKKMSPFPGWLLVFDGYSKSYFYKNDKTGECVFSTSTVNPNALSKTISNIDIVKDDDDDGNDAKMEAVDMAKHLSFNDIENNKN